jgi:uncharacterized repeat protein (TIGR01451 family)
VDVYGPVGTGLGGTAIQTVSPGDTATFQVEIENVDGVNSFDLAWNTPVGWTVTFDGLSSPVTGIPAGIYSLQVIVSSTSLGGTFDLIVDGHKTDKPFFMDSLTGRVIVVPPAVVDGLIDDDGDEVFGALGTGLGGTSTQTTAAPALVNYTVEIQNQGAQADQYQISWGSIPLWGATLNGSPSPVTSAVINAGGASLLTFSVTVPVGALVGDYSYIIDVVSFGDSSSFESLEAAVSVVGPPRVDLIIDGDGTGVFGPLGTGQGGSSVRCGNPGTSYTVSLRVQNAGSFPDSFRIDWQAPVGWPVGSVQINDGATDHAAAFWTAPLLAGQFIDYTVIVQIPAGLDTDGVSTIINSWSSRIPNLPESIELITKTTAVVRGIVFDDRDHDLSFGPGDVGLYEVTVVTASGTVTALTAGDGSYAFSVPSGTAVTVIEHNPSGFISLSPDTVGPSVVNAGDTVAVDFADVPPLYLSAGTVANGLAGGYVDLPHTLEAGTVGHVDLFAANDVGAVTMFMFDQNGNGVFDGNDRTLAPADTDLDPVSGNSVVSVLLRVFVPASFQPGVTFRVDISAVQTIASTTLTSSAGSADVVVVVGSAVGRLAMSKAADKAGAVPGEIITYSVQFFNAGVDSVHNIMLYDPISPFVDPIPDAFGPGLDLEWRPSGSPVVYLTFNDGDGDECDYVLSERLLKLMLSRNSPFYLAPGEAGSFSYRVQVR